MHMTEENKYSTQGHIRPITTIGVPTTGTPRKEKAMHHSIILTTRTTMAWVVVFTVCTLVCIVPQYHTPSWGGIHTLSTLGMVFFLLCTVGMAGTHLWVRNNWSLYLSTRYFEQCTHCMRHHSMTPFECKYGVSEAEYWGL